MYASGVVRINIVEWCDGNHAIKDHELRKTPNFSLSLEIFNLEVITDIITIFGVYNIETQLSKLKRIVKCTSPSSQLPHVSSVIKQPREIEGEGFGMVTFHLLYPFFSSLSFETISKTQFCSFDFECEAIISSWCFLIFPPITSLNALVSTAIYFSSLTKISSYDSRYYFDHFDEKL